MLKMALCALQHCHPVQELAPTAHSVAASKHGHHLQCRSYHLQHMLQQRGLEAGPQQVEQILGGFDDAVAQDDVGPALEQIRAAGIKVRGWAWQSAGSCRTALHMELWDCFAQATAARLSS